LESNSDNQGESYFASMTDMLVGLLFIFIILIVAITLQIKSETGAADIYRDQASDHRKEILVSLKKAIEDKGIYGIIIDENHGILRLPEKLLFDSGKAEVTFDNQVVLSKIASAFKEVISCSVFNNLQVQFNLSEDCKEGDDINRYFIEAIFVEGHTDNVPITRPLQEDSNLKNNMRLSARRATNTLEIMLNSVPELGEYYAPTIYNENNIYYPPQSIFGVSAYGKKRPLNKNLTYQERSDNRRIDFRFIMFIPSSKSEIDLFVHQLIKNIK